MKRNMVLGALMGLLVAPGTRAQNPDDIEFRAEFVKKSAAFHAGGRIQVEISYASSAEKKYAGIWAGPNPFVGDVEVEVTPREEVTDLRELARGWAGSVGGSQDYVSQKPRVQQFELNQWFRFDKPGHFVLTLKSKAVERRKTEEEGGGLERLTLEAEPLAFDILPEDEAWQAAELNEIEGILERTPAQSTERILALHRLSLLDSPAAIKRLVEIYFAGTETDPAREAQQGLNNSRRGDLIIGLLKEGMGDPARNPEATGADLLAELQLRKEMGITPPRPEDAEGQKQWQEKLAERDRARNEFLGQANALILASLKQRTGKARAEATYQAWNNAERQNAGGSGTATLEMLRKEVLETASDLQAGEQLSFVSSSWYTMPHEQLRPIIERLIVNDGEQAPYLRDQGYDFLCRDWPKDCATAILAAVQQPDTKISNSTVLLLAEAEHSELDAMLEAELREAKFPPDSFAGQRLSALVLRAGSKELVKAVQEFLDEPRTPHRYGCQTSAELIGYLFRFVPQDAAKRALAEALDEKSACGRGILQILGRERYSDELLPVAERTLDSENLDRANSAALFLGRRGKLADVDKLRNRLQQLRNTWSERTAQVRGAESVDMGLIPADQAAQQAGRLEEALVSVLVGSENWKLTDEEREELRAGCMTGNCRAMAEGKVRMPF